MTTELVSFEGGDDQKIFLDIFQQVLDIPNMGDEIILLITDEQLLLRGNVGADHLFETLFPEEAMDDIIEGTFVAELDRQRLQDLLKGILTAHDYDEEFSISHSKSEIVLDYEADSSMKINVLENKSAVNKPEITTKGKLSGLNETNFLQSINSLQHQIGEEDIRIVFEENQLQFQFGGGSSLASGNIRPVPYESNLEHKKYSRFSNIILKPLESILKTDHLLEVNMRVTQGNNGPMKVRTVHKNDIMTETVFVPLSEP